MTGRADEQDIGVFVAQVVRFFQASAIGTKADAPGASGSTTQHEFTSISTHEAILE
jgi:hypothetical protein